MSKTLLLTLVACATAVVQAASLTYTKPEGWVQRVPGSSMRVAEFMLPRAAGDREDAQLVVYYFGGEGGGVQENIERWIGQVQHPTAAPRTETRTVNGLTVSLVDVSGTYAADMMPGVAGHGGGDKEHFRLRAGVVETAGGNYFIKLTGPEKTVAKWDRAVSSFIASLKYQ